MPSQATAIVQSKVDAFTTNIAKMDTDFDTDQKTTKKEQGSEALASSGNGILWLLMKSMMVLLSLAFSKDVVLRQLNSQ